MRSDANSVFAGFAAGEISGMRTLPRSKVRGAIAMVQAFLLGPLPLAVVAWVQDWYVDASGPGCPSGGSGTQADPYCRIQDAVNAAADGDTILIAPGTYFENVVLDRDLALIGTGGRQVTILDGMASGSVVRVLDSSIMLTSLTITNGRALRGGGVYIDATSRADVYDAVVTGNTAYAGHSALCGGIGGSGGGIACGNVVTLSDCRVTNNSSVAFGGGISSWVDRPCQNPVIASEIRLARCNVENNSALYGAGVFCESDTVSNATSLSVVDSSLKDNSPDGLWFADSYSGGALTMTNTSISGGDFGMGLSGSSSTSVLIDRSRVSGCSMAAIGVSYCTLTMTNSTISGNPGIGVQVGYRFSYGGSYYYGQGSAALANCTITENSGGGMIVWGPLANTSHAEIRNSIVWKNGSGSIQVPGPGATSVVEYSLVEGGWPGIGNLDASPQFVDPLNGDYRLLSGSACLDAGNNLAVPPSIVLDLGGRNRFLDDALAPDTGNPGLMLPIVDMGAYEGAVYPGRHVRRR